MCIVFVEYKIHAEHLQEYLSWIRDMRASYPHTEWYEGAEQPGLFVEIWHGLSDAEYKTMKAARLGQGEEKGEWGAWKAMIPWVPGGKDKIHIWQFEKVK